MKKMLKGLSIGFMVLALALVLGGAPSKVSATAGAAVTGLSGVLQLGETTTATAATTEAGATSWTSSVPAVATVDGTTGAVVALTAGTTTIGYTASTSGNLNSVSVTVYAAASVANPTIGEVRVGGSTVTPTGFTAAGTGETMAWTSSDTGKATIVSATGVITAVARGATTISYVVTNNANSHKVSKGSLAITVVQTLGAGAVAGVTVPVIGATPVTTTTAGTGYTGAVVWSGSPTTFASHTIYTATITLTVTSGYTLTGITANQFTVAGTTGSATNPINSGVITAVFPVTATTIAATAIAGVSAPETSATPVTTTTAGTGYTGGVTWSPNDATFQPNTVYTATVTLTATSGYSLVGVGVNQFTIARATATNSANAGVITAVFPITGGIGSGGFTSSTPAPSVVYPTVTVTTSPVVTQTPTQTVTVTTTTPVAIPGCLGTTGFSTVSGVSCAGNTGTVTTTTTYNLGNVTLKNGSSGVSVQELQKVLNKILKLNLKIDGKLGPKTVATIKQWQKAHGLKADGLVGAKTKAAMLSEAK